MNGLVGEKTGLNVAGLCGQITGGTDLDVNIIYA